MSVLRIPAPWQVARPENNPLIQAAFVNTHPIAAWDIA